MATEGNKLIKASIKYGSLPAVSLANIHEDADDAMLLSFSNKVSNLLIPQETGVEVKKRCEYSITA